MAVASGRLETLCRCLRLSHERQRHTPAPPGGADGRSGRQSCQSGGGRMGFGAGRKIGVGRPLGRRRHVQTARVDHRPVAAHRHAVRVRQSPVRVAQEGRDLEQQHARRQAQSPREVAAARVHARCCHTATS